MNLVQIQYPNNIDRKRYTFKVPDGIVIRKNDVVRVKNRNGNEEIGIAVTSSVDVSDNIVDMIMSGKDVVSSVIGRYHYFPYEQNEFDI